MERTCKTCKWSTVARKEINFVPGVGMITYFKGKCHVNPPPFPEVAMVDFCSCHDPKEEEE